MQTGRLTEQLDSIIVHDMIWSSNGSEKPVRSLTRDQFLKIFGLSSGALDAKQRAGHVALAFGTPSPAMPGRYCDLDLAALAIGEALAPTLGRPTATTIVL